MNAVKAIHTENGKKTERVIILDYRTHLDYLYGFRLGFTAAKAGEDAPDNPWYVDITDNTKLKYLGWKHGYESFFRQDKEEAMIKNAFYGKMPS